MRSDGMVPGFDEEDDGLKIVLSPVAKVSGGLLLTLDGHVDTYNSFRFQKRVRLAVESGFVRLVFDCGGLSHLSSSGVGSFMTLLKAVRPTGDLVLFNVPPKVLDLLRLLGFSGIFNIRESVDEAVAFFAEGGSGEPAIFPLILRCPACRKRLEAKSPGRFRCPECGAILAVGLDGSVSLG